MINNDQYILANGVKEKLPYFATVIRDYDNCPEKLNLPWLLEIKFVISNPTEQGLVANDEAEELYKFEDFIFTKIKKNTKIFFATRITWNSMRYLYYYISEPKLVSNELNKIIENGQYLKEFQYKIEKDKNWNKLTEFIPNIKEL